MAQLTDSDLKRILLEQDLQNVYDELVQQGYTMFVLYPLSFAYQSFTFLLLQGIYCRNVQTVKSRNYVSF